MKLTVRQLKKIIEEGVHGSSLPGSGEFYADYDEETGTYCVFHTEGNRAFASFTDKDEAESVAAEMNASGSKPGPNRMREGDDFDLESELNNLEVGDVVDVDQETMGTLPVRILAFVDDVNEETGVMHDPNAPGYEDFKGPGFIGEIDPSSGESGTMVFALTQVMPGSKIKGYFPKLGDEYDEDDWGRKVHNPYRKMAKVNARQAISRPSDYIQVEGLNEDEVMRDPFRTPEAAIKSVLVGLAGAMKGGLMSMPKTISNAMADVGEDPKARDALQKAKGLVQHAQRDIEAAAAMLAGLKKKKQLPT